VLRDRQPPDDEEADADAAEAAAVTRLALHEPLEDPLVVAWGDADALIFDVHLDQRAHGAAAHRDGPAGRRVLEGVLEQLADDDVRGHRITAGRRQAVWHVRDHLVLVRQRAERHDRRAQQRREVERAVGHGQRIGSRPCAEQELLDKPAERARPLRDRAHRGPPVGV
jgi:hypothetical protein